MTEKRYPVHLFKNIVYCDEGETSEAAESSKLAESSKAAESFDKAMNENAAGEEFEEEGEESAEGEESEEEDEELEDDALEPPLSLPMMWMHLSQCNQPGPTQAPARIRI